MSTKGQVVYLLVATILFVVSRMAGGVGIAVPLEVLVQEADAIAHVERLTSQKNTGGNIVEFRVRASLKGNLGDSVFICNNKAVETYDLNGYNAKELIVFLRSGSGCYSPTRGLSSTIKIEAGTAHTWPIKAQPVDEFSRSILQHLTMAAKGGR